MKKETKEKPIGRTTIGSYYASSAIVYLFISKPNWYNLLDADGYKLKIPPTWYCGGSVDKWRISSHTSTDDLTDETLDRTKVQQYLRENNLKINTRYYFDVYILDLTEFMYHFSRLESDFVYNRRNIIKYVHAMEHMIKHDLRHYFIDAYPSIIKFHTPDAFILNGKPIISRFDDIWGDDDTGYWQYSIENLADNPRKETRAMQKQLFAFIRKLCYSNQKHILDDALNPLTYTQFNEIARERTKEREKRYKPNQINKDFLMP